MIKRNNKKGFTIVELVIVIAVIAILAAVLIPTFSGLIKKANISKDTQLAKNLNTILLSEEAEGKKPADFSEVLSVLRENGYVVENLNPTTEGYYFVWESSTNQILLVDESFKLAYSSKDLEDGVATIGATWFFAVKDATLIDAIKTAGGSVIPAVDTAWIGGDATKVKELLTQGGVVTLNESITLTTAPDHTDGNGKKDGIRIKDGQEVTLNLAGQTLTVDFDTTDYRAFQVWDGSLALTDGKVIASAEKTDSGLTLYGIAYIGGSTAGSMTVENMDIIFNGATDAPKGQAGAVFMCATNGTLVVKDTTVSFSNTAGLECYAGTTTLENVTFKLATGEGKWSDTAVAVSGGGTVNIKSGTYTAGLGYCAGVWSTGGTLNISGGTFEGNLFIGNDHKSTSVDSVINITGGTFDGEAFNSLSEDDWKTLCGNVTGLVVTGAGTNNVTIKLAK